MKKKPYSRYSARKRSSKKQTLPIRLRWVVLVFILFLVFVFFSGPKSIIRLYSLEQEKHRLEMLKERKEKESQKLEEEIQRLESDTSYIIKMAREKYQLKHPDEKVWIIEPK